MEPAWMAGGSGRLEYAPQRWRSEDEAIRIWERILFDKDHYRSANSLVGLTLIPIYRDDSIPRGLLPANAGSSFGNLWNSVFCFEYCLPLSVMPGTELEIRCLLPRLGRLFLCVGTFFRLMVGVPPSSLLWYRYVGLRIGLGIESRSLSF